MVPAALGSSALDPLLVLPFPDGLGVITVKSRVWGRHRLAHSQAVCGRERKGSSIV